MEAAPGFEPGMRVLQTRALPLGDAAFSQRMLTFFYSLAEANPMDLRLAGQLPLFSSRRAPSRAAAFPSPLVEVGGAGVAGMYFSALVVSGPLEVVSVDSRWF